MHATAKKKSAAQNNRIYDVLILGAGASGIGTAVVLHELGVTNYAILEKGTVGQSFLEWTQETRFITPSFTSNMFFMPDLNAVTPLTSPAYSSDSEHVSGPQYAAYLQLLADHYALPIQEHTTIVDIQKEKESGVFVVEDAEGNTYHAQVVIAALGEWSTPNTHLFPGASLAQHTATITAYADIHDDACVVIGSGESAFDFAYNMAARGKEVTMIDPGNALEAMQREDDPSKKISPKTYRNLMSLKEQSLVKFLTHSKVIEIKKGEGEYTIVLENGDTIASQTTPYLATGFKKLPEILEPHIHTQQNGDLDITTYDESRATKNMFIVGPTVHRQRVILCFIYKFRMRFAVVACEIAKRLHKDAQTIKNVKRHYKKYTMYLQNIAQCGIGCDC